MKILVIGAVSGLGEALVRTAIARGDGVSALDVNEAGLRKLGPAVAQVVCDISDGTAIEWACGALKSEGPFDLVVISAGISAVGRFEEIAPNLMDRVVSVNLIGSIMLAAAMLKHQLIATSGRLVFVSSLSHYVAYPGASAYAATKDGIVVFAKSIRRSLKRGRGITVQVIMPGPMDTPHAERYAPRNGRRGRRIDPDRVATSILRNTRGRIIIPGIAAQLAALAGAAAPRRMGLMMRRLIYDCI